MIEFREKTVQEQWSVNDVSLEKLSTNLIVSNEVEGFLSLNDEKEKVLNRSQ